MTGNRELTVASVLIGCLLSVVFGAANAYLGLRVGLTVSASIPAAVVSMAILRVVLRRDSIRENAMVQTIGSAGESLSAGAVFTMPALYMWAEEGLVAPPGFLPLTLIALAGGTLGALFMVPLRKALVEDEDRTLPFPEGRACAEVLRAGESGARGARLVFAGLGAAVGVKLLTDLFKWLPAAVNVPFRRLRGELGVDVSAALAAVGYVVGPKVATLIFSGSFLGWMVAIPLFCVFSDAAAAAHADGGATAVWSGYVRYVGAGAIATGGFFALVRSVPLFAKTFRNAVRRLPAGGARDDLPLGRVLAGCLATVLLIAMVPSVGVGVGGALLVALFGFFFAAVSARMVGLIGSSNNPVSGMTIATLVVSGLVLKTCGMAGAAGMVSTIAVGSVVAIVAAIAGDTAQDLKTGWLVGATPWKLQIGELVGVVSSALAIAMTLLLLHRAWNFGSAQIPAPQATLMKVVVEGIMGGTLPWGLVGIGVAFALVLEVLRIPAMPVALGLYLPVRLNTTIFLGGCVRWAIDRLCPSSADRGTLVSAGLIAGEGIAGIALAVLALLR